MSEERKEVTVQPAPGADTPLDSGQQALSEALRSSFGIFKVVMVVLVIVFLGSGVFQVKQGERAIKLRLGKPVGQGESALLQEGLHWSWPYPIEEYVKVSVTGVKQVRSTAGWYAVTPEQELAKSEPPPGPSLNALQDGYVLTGDGNIAHSRAILSYHVEDPIAYVFDFVNASNAIQSALDDALLYAASRHTIDDIWNKNVIAFREAVEDRVKQLVERQKLGIVVEQVSVESVPPRQLKEAFGNVLKAEVIRNKVLNEALSYANQVTNKASADARTRIDMAESDRARHVAEVSSQARRFEDLLPSYDANPNLFVQQRLTETVGRVLANAQDKFYITERTDGRPQELRLQTNPDKPKKPEEPRQP